MRNKFWKIFLIVVTIWGCIEMIYGSHVDNIEFCLFGCTFWLYGLIMLKLEEIADDVSFLTVTSASKLLEDIRRSAASRPDSE